MPETAAYLRTGAQYVHSELPLTQTNPSEFYRGNAAKWVGISQDLDVRRRVADTIMCDVILADESDRSSKFEFYVMLAEAGAGKSTCLQRIAWDATNDDGKLCVYIDSQGSINIDAIADIANSTSRRLFLFIDDVADHIQGTIQLAAKAIQDELLITIIAAERQNEWNNKLRPLESARFKCVPIGVLDYSRN